MTERRIIIAGVDCTGVVRANVERIPPLSAAQKAKLRVLLRPAAKAAG